MSLRSFFVPGGTSVVITALYNVSPPFTIYTSFNINVAMKQYLINN